MKHAYTEGNWIAVGAQVESDNDDIPDIASCNPEHFGHHHIKPPRSYNEQRANAMLCAGSKQMAEAIQHALDVRYHHGAHSPQMHDALRACCDAWEKATNQRYRASREAP